MRNKKLGYALGMLQLLALLQAYVLWLAPFTMTVTDGFSQIVQYLTVIISIILLALPVASITLIYLDKRSGFIFLAIFPLCCIFFGITAFPFISYLYGSHIKLNSLFTAFTNALVCAAAFWFFVSARSDFSSKTAKEFSEANET